MKSEWFYVGAPHVFDETLPWGGFSKPQVVRHKSAVALYEKPVSSDSCGLRLPKLICPFKHAIFSAAGSVFLSRQVFSRSDPREFSRWSNTRGAPT
jgi:hypothetical protein